LREREREVVQKARKQRDARTCLKSEHEIEQDAETSRHEVVQGNRCEWFSVRGDIVNVKIQKKSCSEKQQLKQLEVCTNTLTASGGQRRHCEV